MEILVYAEQFRNARWDVWEHNCSPSEVDAVVSFALARASQRSSGSKPNQADFLEGARQIFDVVRDAALSPKDGDTRVYCICVDQMVIGVYEKIRQYSHKLAVSREQVAVPLRMSA